MSVGLPAALTKALAALGKPKTAKNLATGFTALEKAINGEGMQQTLGFLENFGVSVKPLAGPFQMVLNQLREQLIPKILGHRGYVDLLHILPHTCHHDLFYDL